MLLGALAKLSLDLNCRRKAAYFLHRLVRAHSSSSAWALTCMLYLLLTCFTSC
jgi:hypothetical protein